ncbi:MAG: hypothetical protein RL761_1642 [Pseudomonadota bacterium]|jgi:hypothetical protein
MNLKKLSLLKIASAALLATAGLAAQAAGPDWSLIITGPGIVVPPAPAQVAPVRVAPIVVAPPVAMSPAQITAVQGGRPDVAWERERDRHYQDNFQARFQERENYYMERERAFQAREHAFLEREKQRQLVVDNNRAAAQAINDRQDAQLDKVVEGVNAGQITREQFAALMAQQKDIRNKERTFLADGFLSQQEYQTLQADMDTVDQAIRFASRGRPQPRERIYYPQNR